MRCYLYHLILLIFSTALCNNKHTVRVLLPNLESISHPFSLFFFLSRVVDLNHTYNTPLHTVEHTAN